MAYSGITCLQFMTVGYTRGKRNHLTSHLITCEHGTSVVSEIRNKTGLSFKLFRVIDDPTGIYCLRNQQSEISRVKPNLT